MSSPPLLPFFVFSFFLYEIVQPLIANWLRFVQPENPAEFGARVYEMMGLALAGQNNAAAKQTEEASSAENPSEVVEASEVLTENDAWQS